MNIYCDVNRYRHFGEIDIPFTKECTGIEMGALPTTVLLVEDKKRQIFFPVLCIVKEHSSENYDYNWDEELEYQGMDTEYSYIPIKYNPYTGEEIKFVFEREYDISMKVDEIIKAYKILEIKHKDRKRINKLYALRDELTKLGGNDKVILSTDDYSKIYGQEFKDCDLLSKTAYLLSYDNVKESYEQVEEQIENNYDR